jgi:hypothetical protein
MEQPNRQILPIRRSFTYFTRIKHKYRSNISYHTITIHYQHNATCLSLLILKSKNYLTNTLLKALTQDQMVKFYELRLYFLSIPP